MKAALPPRAPQMAGTRVLDRLAQVESLVAVQEPSIQALVPETGRFDRLRRESSMLRAATPDEPGGPRLAGVLLGVKDIFRVSGFPTRAGSRLPEELFQGQEAESVTRLKSAGALILGKTVTTEFAYFSPGPTRNPHNLEHTPGGSSSGSAAAVAAGYCDLALGTQTIGSIIRPAAFCGVIGFKPTYDRISRAGVIALAPSLDHVGFFAADIDMATRAAEELITEWNAGFRPEHRPVLGIPDGPYLEGTSPEATQHFEQVCESLGAEYEVRRVPLLADFQVVRERHDVILAAEAAKVHAAWFEAYEGLYSTKFAELVRRGRVVTKARLQAALQERTRFRDDLMRTMRDQGIDVWISPSATGPAPQGLDATGDPVMNLPWTQAGLPAMNIPSGMTDGGLPLGLQVVAGWNMDEALLAWAPGILQVVKHQ